MARRRRLNLESAETADTSGVFGAAFTEGATARTAAQAWLVTFTDLVSLMLTFFVMLFGMSDVNIEKWDLIIAALTKTLNPQVEEEEVEKQAAEFNIGSLFRRRAVDLDYLEDVLQDTIEDEPQLARVRLTRLEDRLILALPEDLLFDPGRAELHERARGAVFVLGGVFSNIGNELQINGHTGPIPPNAAHGYATNWEVSIARAAAVANAFRQVGYKDKIAALGYADSRFDSLPEGDPLERRKLARRVDVIVTPEASRK